MAIHLITHCQPGFCTINGVGNRFVEMHMWLLKAYKREEVKTEGNTTAFNRLSQFRVEWA